MKNFSLLETSARSGVTPGFRFLLLFICIICAVSSGQLNAQQSPLFNGQLYTPELFNPARLGEGFLGLTYRHQWMDLDSRYAPVSIGLNADVSSLLNLTEKRIGLGISLLSDKVHLMQRYNAGIGFAYRLVNDDRHRLTAAVQAGISSQRFDFQDAGLFDPSDRALFLEQQNKVAFDGGPGLYYAFTASDQHSIAIDVSAPQLFSSDLNYAQGAVWNLQPQLMTRLSYRFQTDAFGIEPILAYREILGDKKLKAGNLELALRANFLNNRVWVGGGARLDAETFHITLGVRPTAKLQVSGAMELNTVFGNTLEFGALYQFEETSTPPQRENLTDELTQFNYVLSKAGIYADEIALAVQRAEEKLGSSSDESLSTSQKRKRIEEAQQGMAQGKARLNMLKELKAQTLTIKQSADEKTSRYKPLFKSQEYKSIVQDEAAVNSLTAKSEKSLSDMEARLAAAEAALPPAIEVSVGKGDLAQIKAYFQERLLKLENLPRHTAPVNVQKNERSIEVAFEFSNQVEQYDVSVHNDLRDVRNLADHVAGEIAELQSLGIVVEGVQLRAKLRDDERSLQSIRQGAYKGEYGASFTLSYRFVTTSNNRSAPKSKALKRNDNINMEHIAALKLHALKTRITQQYNGTLNFDPLEIAAPHSGQTFTQMYVVKIKIRQ